MAQLADVALRDSAEKEMSPAPQAPTVLNDEVEDVDMGGHGEGHTHGAWIRWAAIVAMCKVSRLEVMAKNPSSMLLHFLTNPMGDVEDVADQVTALAPADGHAALRMWSVAHGVAGTDRLMEALERKGALTRVMSTSNGAPTPPVFAADSGAALRRVLKSGVGLTTMLSVCRPPNVPTVEGILSVIDVWGEALDEVVPLLLVLASDLDSVRAAVNDYLSRGGGNVRSAAPVLEAKAMLKRHLWGPHVLEFARIMVYYSGGVEELLSHESFFHVLKYCTMTDVNMTFMPEMVYQLCRVEKCANAVPKCVGDLPSVAEMCKGSGLSTLFLPSATREGILCLARRFGAVFGGPLVKYVSPGVGRVYVPEFREVVKLQNLYKPVMDRVEWQMLPVIDCPLYSPEELEAEDSD